MIIEKAYAKLNLTLEIVGKSEGYHLLESIVVPVNLYDELTFTESKEDVVISNVNIPNNNIYEAIKLFRTTFKINKCVKITLTKNIPIGSGMGGSSADISATLRGLNKFFKINKSFQELEPLANQLGSDTLFCLYNKRAFISGRGDVISFLNASPKMQFLVIYPQTSLSTKAVFQNYQTLKKSPYVSFDESLFSKENINVLLKNDLLKSALSLNKELKAIYYKLKEKGIKANLTGAGSALFIVNPDVNIINEIEVLFKNDVIWQLINEL